MSNVDLDAFTSDLMATLNGKAPKRRLAAEMRLTAELQAMEEFDKNLATELAVTKKKLQDKYNNRRAAIKAAKAAKSHRRKDVSTVKTEA